MESQWLAISLFSAKSNWHIILKEAIKPFIRTMREMDLMEKFEFKFNSFCGDNIQLFLLTRNDLTDALAKNADNHFKLFFLQKRLSKKKIKLPYNGIFLPFPGNTIQYGLFYKMEGNPEDIDFKQELSELMIEALGEELIDIETLITFAFYLRLGLLKSIEACTCEMKRTDKLIEIIPIERFMQVDVKIKSRYEDNEEVLREIYLEIMSPSSKSETVPGWLKQWIKSCENKIKKDLTGSIEIVCVHNQIADIISGQLETNTYTDSFIGYSIWKTFSTERLIDI